MRRYYVRLQSYIKQFPIVPDYVLQNFFTKSFTCLIFYLFKSMRRFLFFIPFCLSCFCIFQVRLSAHPHMSFTSTAEFIFEKKKLKGVFVEWTFDRFFSADIISGYDTDRDGKFNKAETAEVYENAFSYTENYYYFCFIRQGSKRTSPEKISGFSVRQNNGIVTYRFFVDLKQFKGRELFFAVYDYTFFCDITYPKGGVKFVYDTEFIKPSYSITENKNYPVYYNPIGPIEDTRIYYKWAPGLETYYPKEIAVRF